jgi:hypothetical protein
MSTVSDVFEVPVWTLETRKPTPKQFEEAMSGWSEHWALPFRILWAEIRALCLGLQRAGAMTFKACIGYGEGAYVLFGASTTSTKKIWNILGCDPEAQLHYSGTLEDDVGYILEVTSAGRHPEITTQLAQLLYNERNGFR